MQIIFNIMIITIFDKCSHEYYSLMSSFPFAKISLQAFRNSQMLPVQFGEPTTQMTLIIHAEYFTITL